MNEAKAALTAIKVVVAAISAITVLLGVVNASVIAALNTLGVVGLASLVIGGGTWGSSSSESRMDRIRKTAWAVGITTAVSGIALAFGRPLDENEKAAGLLTVIGVAFVLGVLTLGVLAYSETQGASEPTKRCPACAETILAAAKKCKHCGEVLTDTNLL